MNNMKKINSKDLYKYVNELGTNEIKKFNVYYDDMLEGQVTWNGTYFEWESGTFTSEIFFDPIWFFGLVEDEQIRYPILHKTSPNETTGDEMPNWRYLIDYNFEYLNNTICQLIDEINNLKENG